MRKREKEFDAVRMMRGARDRLSRQLSGMSFEEQKRYIRERLAARDGHAPKTEPKSSQG